MKRRRIHGEQLELLKLIRSDELKRRRELLNNELAGRRPDELTDTSSEELGTALDIVHRGPLVSQRRAEERDALGPRT